MTKNARHEASKQKASPRGKRKLEFIDKKKHKTPLTGKTIFLDVKDAKVKRRIEEDLKKLGAIVETFLSKDISYLITSNPPLKQAGKNDKYDSQGSPSISTPSPFNMGPSPSPGTAENGQQANVTVLRGKAIYHKAKITTGNQSQKNNLVVDNAQKWGVKIVGIDTAVKWVQKEVSKLPEPVKKEKKATTATTSKKGEFKVKTIKAPFIKFEDETKQYRSVFHHLETWPHINIDTPKGTCPFDGTRVNRDDESMGDRRDKIGLPNVDDEEKDLADQEDSPNDSKNKKSESIIGPVKVMTAGDIRRQVQKKRQMEKKRGYCECCLIKYENIDKHIREEMHRGFVRDKKNYESLDHLIKTGTNCSTAKFLQRTLNHHLRKGKPSCEVDVSIPEEKQWTPRKSAAAKLAMKAQRSGSTLSSKVKIQDANEINDVSNDVKSDLVSDGSSKENRDIQEQNVSQNGKSPLIKKADSPLRKVQVTSPRLRNRMIQSTPKTDKNSEKDLITQKLNNMCVNSPLQIDLTCLNMNTSGVESTVENSNCSNIVESPSRNTRSKNNNSKLETANNASANPSIDKDMKEKTIEKTDTKVQKEKEDAQECKKIEKKISRRNIIPVNENESKDTQDSNIEHMDVESIENNVNIKSGNERPKTEKVKDINKKDTETNEISLQKNTLDGKDSGVRNSNKEDMKTKKENKELDKSDMETKALKIVDINVEQKISNDELTELGNHLHCGTEVKEAKSLEHETKDVQTLDIDEDYQNHVVPKITKSNIMEKNLSAKRVDWSGPKSMVVKEAKVGIKKWSQKREQICILQKRNSTDFDEVDKMDTDEKSKEINFNLMDKDKCQIVLNNLTMKYCNDGGQFIKLSQNEQSLVEIGKNGSQSNTRNEALDIYDFTDSPRRKKDPYDMSSEISFIATESPKLNRKSKTPSANINKIVDSPKSDFSRTPRSAKRLLRWKGKRMSPKKLIKSESESKVKKLAKLKLLENSPQTLESSKVEIGKVLKSQETLVSVGNSKKDISNEEEPMEVSETRASRSRSRTKKSEEPIEMSETKETRSKSRAEKSFDLDITPIKVCKNETKEKEKQIDQIVPQIVDSSENVSRTVKKKNSAIQSVAKDHHSSPIPKSLIQTLIRKRTITPEESNSEESRAFDDNKASKDTAKDLCSPSKRCLKKQSKRNEQMSPNRKKEVLLNSPSRKSKATEISMSPKSNTVTTYEVSPTKSVMSVAMSPKIKSSIMKGNVAIQRISPSRPFRNKDQSTEKTPKKSSQKPLFQSGKEQSNKSPGRRLMWKMPNAESKKTKKVKLNGSWSLLSDRSIGKLLESDNGEENFEGFSQEEVFGESSLGSDASFVETTEIDLDENSREEWVMDAEVVSQESDNDINELVPVFSSPGKCSDSSWDDACDTYIQTQVSFNSSVSKVRHECFSSPKKRQISPRKRKRQASASENEGFSNKLQTPKQKKKKLKMAVDSISCGLVSPVLPHENETIFSSSPMRAPAQNTSTPFRCVTHVENSKNRQRKEKGNSSKDKMLKTRNLNGKDAGKSRRKTLESKVKEKRVRSLRSRISV